MTDTTEWSYGDARKALKKIRGMAADKTYNIYVRNMVIDLSPVLSFMIDKLETLEEKP